jgi:hypothetical protein
MASVSLHEKKPYKRFLLCPRDVSRLLDITLDLLDNTTSTSGNESRPRVVSSMARQETRAARGE